MSHSSYNSVPLSTSVLCWRAIKTHVFQTYVREGLYQWANDVLIPNLYYTVNYNGESSSSYEQGYLADMYSWRLGPPILRQLRVKKGILDFLAFPH